MYKQRKRCIDYEFINNQILWQSVVKNNKNTKKSISEVFNWPLDVAITII